MSAEVSSFSKRAAAELSRCFNGLSSSSSSSSSSNTNNSSTSFNQSSSSNSRSNNNKSPPPAAEQQQNAGNKSNISLSMGTTLSTTSSLANSTQQQSQTKQQQSTILTNNGQNSLNLKDNSIISSGNDTGNEPNIGSPKNSPPSSSTPTSSTSSSRSSFGGAFRGVFKNSEKLLSPLKGSNSKSQQQHSTNVVESSSTNPTASINNNVANHHLPQQNVTTIKSSSSSSSSSTAANTANPMTPSKQTSSLQNQARRPSRNGPPPKAPPKTNRARRKNYLLNLQKSLTIETLFEHDQEFLQKRFFPCFTPLELCRLSQVCKTWCQLLYSEPVYWKSLTLTLHYGELRQMEKQQTKSLNGDRKPSAKQSNGTLNDIEYENNNNNLCKQWNNQLNIQASSDNFMNNNNLVTSNAVTVSSKNKIPLSPEVFALLDGLDPKTTSAMTATTGNVDDRTDYLAEQIKQRRRHRFFHSIFHVRRFETICLLGPNDTDLVELSNYYKVFVSLSMKNNNNNNKNILTKETDIEKSSSTKKFSAINLSHIIIRNASITDQGLEVLLNTFAPLLQSFELIGCNELTNSGLWSGLVPNLHLLTIQDCINISDDTVATICQLLTQLQTFQFQAYHVTDIAMAYFSTSMMRQTLRVLTLQHCWEITNQGVANVAHSLPNLTSLSLSGCSKVTDDAIEVVAEQLRNLTTLDLSWCPRISDAALEYIACDLADTLKTLVLDRCLHVTDIGLGYLATMANLENLSVRWCPQIRDFGLQALTSLRSLRTLSIAGCTHVTITGLSFITRMAQLEEIELTNCPAASKDLIKYLSESLPESCAIIT